MFVAIRNLEKSDSDQVALLIPQLTKNIVEPEKLSDRIKLLAEPGNFQYVVAELHSKVVGFGGLTWYPIPSKGFVGQIEEVVVDENYRGQGIGFIIVVHLKKIAKTINLKQVKLTAKPEARSLYEKCGFVAKSEDLMVYKL